MDLNRKLQPALLSRPFHEASRQEAREIADWLNGGTGGERGEFLTIRNAAQSHARAALIHELISVPGRSSFWLEPQLPGWGVLQFRPQLVRTGGRMALTLVGQDMDSRLWVACMSLSYASLLEKVRQCGRCAKWYLVRKGRFCSTLCRVKWHYRTPEGRQKRAKYMRHYRATCRRLWERKRKGRQLKRGRNIHVSLKKGE
jgi:hypothetical protein